jgi:hypothetical protein
VRSRKTAPVIPGGMNEKHARLRFQRVGRGGMLGAGGEAMPTWAWVLIIVLLFLLVFGGFGYSRR